jgi:hypothetical protein
MKRVVILAAVLALALPAITFAQAKPDFSGTWKVDMEKSVMPQRGGGGGGGGGGAAGGGGGAGARGGGGGGMAEMVVKQTPTELSITTGAGEAAATRTYKLDGSEATITLPGRGGNPGAEIKVKSTWQGAKLVSEWSQAGRGGDMQTVKESIYMEGASLVRETDRGGTVTKLVYNK